jgi:hypothetical protein
LAIRDVNHHSHPVMGWFFSPPPFKWWVGVIFKHNHLSNGGVGWFFFTTSFWMVGWGDFYHYWSFWFGGVEMVGWFYIPVANTRWFYRFSSTDFTFNFFAEVLLQDHSSLHYNATLRFKDGPFSPARYFAFFQSWKIVFAR